MAPRKKKKVGRKAALKFEDLPEGWIKEETIRIKDPSRKDALYIDLESGISFRSLSDVKKYLRNGHIAGCFSRPKLMEKEKLAALIDRNSASGSGSKPIEPEIESVSKSSQISQPASGSGSKPIRKKRSTRNRLTLTKRKPTTTPLKTALKKPDSSEPCHTEGHTVSPWPKRKRKVWGSPVRSSPRLARERTPLTTFDKEDVLTPFADVAKDEDRDDGVMTPVADVAVVTMIEPELGSELLNECETETGQKEEVVLESETLLPSVEDLPGGEPGLGDEISVQNMPGGGPGVGNEMSVENMIGGGPGLGDEIPVENMPAGKPGVGNKISVENMPEPGLGDEISVENMTGGGPSLGDEILAGGGLGLGEELLPGGEPISEYFGDFWQDSLNFAFRTLTGDDEFVIPIESDIVGPSNGNINNNNNDNNNVDEEGGNDNGGGNEGANESRDNNGGTK